MTKQKQSGIDLSQAASNIGYLDHKCRSLFHTGLKVNRTWGNTKAGVPALLLKQGQGTARIAAATPGDSRGALG